MTLLRCVDNGCALPHGDVMTNTKRFTVQLANKINARGRNVGNQWVVCSPNGAICARFDALDDARTCRDRCNADLT